MRLVLLASLLILLTVSAQARRRGDGFSMRAPRSCHCDRYTDPHYYGYVPRTAPYRGGRATRY